MLQILNHGFTFEREAPHRRPMAWPDTNRYFYEGVMGYFNSAKAHPEKLKVVFVDFQLSNLPILLGQDWLVYSIRHRIILVTDSYLLPLANYYKGLFHQIDAVIQSKGSPEDFFNQIEHVISGKKITPSSKSRLSSREICLLRALTRGVTVRDIAHRLQLSPKTVYAMRHNMLGKMGLNKMSDIYMPTVNGAK